jgi:transcriptional regulator with XRE-family HTH domain
MREEARAIGARLHLCRKRVKMSLSYVGEHMRVSRQAVSAWEKGESVCDLLQLAALCRLYGESADYVLHGIKTAPVGGQMVADIFRERSSS